MSLVFLQKLGLTDKEVRLYQLLLQIGESAAAEIIKASRLKRPTVYKTLYSLEKKGLINQKNIGKKIHFCPEPPLNLLRLAESQAQTQNQIKDELLKLIPQLDSNYILAVEKPVVSTFEGLEGLKEIYQDTLREKQPIYAVLQTSEVNQEMFKWLKTTYVKQRIKNKIPAKVIVASGDWSHQYQQLDKKELRESLTVSGKKFPFKHEVDLYGDKVAFINYKKGESLIGIVIKHPQIAQTMKAWFDLAWFGALQSFPKNKT